MALYNQLTQDDLKRQCTGIANEMSKYMARWKFFADRLNTIDDTELDSLGFTTEWKNMITSLKTACWNVELKYRNQTPLNGDDASWIVGEFANLVVF